MMPAKMADLSSNPRHASPILLRLYSKRCQATVMTCANSSLGVFYTNLPDLLIIDLSVNTVYALGVVSPCCL